MYSNRVFVVHFVFQLRLLEKQFVLLVARSVIDVCHVGSLVQGRSEVGFASVPLKPNLLMISYGPWREHCISGVLLHELSRPMLRAHATQHELGTVEAWEAPA